MTPEEKNLLLNDVCARLPYGVKVAFLNEDLTHHSEPKTLVGIECINNLNYSKLEDEDGNTTIVEFVKPYLFPLSSMTEEQKKEWHSLMRKEYREQYPNSVVNTSYYEYFPTIESFDYLYSRHLDFRGLIPMGLALNATGLNIYE